MKVPSPHGNGRNAGGGHSRRKAEARGRAPLAPICSGPERPRFPRGSSPSPSLLVATDALQVVLAEVQPPAAPPAARAVLRAQPQRAGSHHQHRFRRRRPRLVGRPNQREAPRVPHHRRQLLRRGRARQPPQQLLQLQAAAADAQRPQHLGGQRHGRPRLLSPSRAAPGGPGPEAAPPPPLPRLQGEETKAKPPPKRPSQREGAGCGAAAAVPAGRGAESSWLGWDCRHAPLPP